MLHNGIKETTSSTGTALTLAAETGFVRFSEAFAVGSLVQYAISNGNNWEWGIGEITSANTLTRPTKPRVTYSSGTYSTAPSAGITLSGDSVVTCTANSGSFSTTSPVVEGTGGIRKVVVNGAVFDNMSNNITYFDFNTRFNISPWYHNYGGEVDAFTIYCTQAESGKTMRWGLYAPNATGGPGKLVVESGDIDVSSTGWKIGTFTARRLPVGWYYLGGFSDASSVRIHGSNVAPSMRFAPWGCVDVSLVTGYKTAITFGSGMPDPAPTGLSFTTTAYLPGMALRAV